MDIQHLKYKNELNIDSFIHMLDDTTECYKFYWLDALLKLFSLGKTEIVFDDLINQMIAMRGILLLNIICISVLKMLREK